ncbi:MAG: hypothetical protein ACOCUL_02230 [Bacteroidota bacterium]
MRKTFFFILLVLFISSCKTYQVQHPFYSEFDQFYHREIAILPFFLFTEEIERPLDSIINFEKSLGYFQQRELYNYMLENKNRFAFEIQDVERTNKLLHEYGYSYRELKKMGYFSKLCNSLEVDAVMIVKVKSRNLMAGTPQLLLSIRSGFRHDTMKEIDLQAFLYSNLYGTSLWKFNQQLSGSVLSRNHVFFQNMIKKMIKIMPFQKNKDFFKQVEYTAEHE